MGFCLLGCTDICDLLQRYRTCPKMGGKSMQAIEWILTVKNIDQDEDNNKLTKVNPQLTQRFGNIQSEIFRPSPEIIAFVNMI